MPLMWSAKIHAGRNEVGAFSGLDRAVDREIFEFGSSSSKAEHDPLIVPAKRQTGVIEELL